MPGGNDPGKFMYTKLEIPIFKKTEKKTRVATGSYVSVKLSHFKNDFKNVNFSLTNYE